MMSDIISILLKDFYFFAHFIVDFFSPLFKDNQSFDFINVSCYGGYSSWCPQVMSLKVQLTRDHLGKGST